MYLLIAKKFMWDAWSPTLVYNGVETWGIEVLPPESDKFPDLDPVLADLMARCMAKDPQQRPSLEDMLRETEAGARKLIIDYVPQIDLFRESNDVIQAMLRLFIYNAEVVPHPGGFPSAVVREMQNFNAAFQPAHNI